MLFSVLESQPRTCVWVKAELPHGNGICECLALCWAVDNTSMVCSLRLLSQWRVLLGPWEGSRWAGTRSLITHRSSKLLPNMVCCDSGLLSAWWWCSLLSFTSQWAPLCFPSLALQACPSAPPAVGCSAPCSPLPSALHPPIQPHFSRSPFA